MYKDLEKEYKELMSADAPDLWAKIEAGLEPNRLNGKKIGRIKNMRVWGAAAAAAAFFCLALTVPVMLGGRKGFSADGSMADVSMSPAENFANAAGSSAKENVGSATTAGDAAPEAEAASGEGALVSNRLKNGRKFFMKNNFFP